MSVVEPYMAHWAGRIRPHLTQTVESILAAGRELIAAKEALPHGQFGPLLDELGLSAEMARRFMRIADHPVLNQSPVTGLPASISTLDELTRWEPDELAEAIDSGEVTPATTRAEAQAKRKQLGGAVAPGPTCCGRPVHPVLALIPAMRPHERAGLRASISRWGCLQPILVDQHGVLLDGRERLLAATELNVPYRVDVIRLESDEGALAVIWALNVLRQHYTDGQIAMAEITAAEVAAR